MPTYDRRTHTNTDGRLEFTEKTLDLIEALRALDKLRRQVPGEISITVLLDVLSEMFDLIRSILSDPDMIIFPNRTPELIVGQSSTASQKEAEELVVSSFKRFATKKLEPVSQNWIIQQLWLSQEIVVSLKKALTSFAKTDLKESIIQSTPLKQWLKKWEELQKLGQSLIAIAQGPTQGHHAGLLKSPQGNQIQTEGKEQRFYSYRRRKRRAKSRHNNRKRSS